MPHYPELLTDVPEGFESWLGDRGDQEGDGLLEGQFVEGLQMREGHT